MSETTRKQVKPTLKNGNPINEDAQFGKPNGNPRHNGAWKKEETLRYKWQKLTAMSDEELEAILASKDAGRVEKMTAEVLLDKEMRPSEKMAVLFGLANQVYGMPKQVNENKNIEIKPILPMKEKK